jgi:putative transposase
MPIARGILGMQKRLSFIGWRTASRVLVDVVSFLSLSLRSRSQLAAENPFLRKQLALYAERRVKAHRADDGTRITMVLLARLIDWTAVLTIVKPDTLIRWHRKGFRLSWPWKSKARGRPSLPVDVDACSRRWLERTSPGAKSGLQPN